MRSLYQLQTEIAITSLKGYNFLINGRYFTLPDHSARYFQ